jgi:hypothetical protein
MRPSNTSDTMCMLEWPPAPIGRLDIRQDEAQPSELPGNESVQLARPVSQIAFVERRKIHDVVLDGVTTAGISVD